jgi:hypothetical protein
MLETDTFTDDNGIIRYSKGNSLGKHPSSIAPGNGPIGQPITTENTDEYRNLRVQKGQQAIADALAEHPDCRTDADGLKMIAEAQITLAADPDAGHASTGAAKFIYQYGEYYRDNQGRAPQLAIQINITPGVHDQATDLSSLVMLDDNDDE